MTEPQIDNPTTAAPLPMLPRIVAVVADAKTHSLLATFATGEQRHFDLSPLLDQGVFRKLREPAVFTAAFVDEIGGIEWPNGAGLSRDTIYLAGVPV